MTTQKISCIKDKYFLAMNVAWHSGRVFSRLPTSFPQHPCIFPPCGTTDDTGTTFLCCYAIITLSCICVCFCATALLVVYCFFASSCNNGGVVVVLWYWYEECHSIIHQATQASFCTRRRQWRHGGE
jgi:hypothetical protein